MDDELAHLCVSTFLATYNGGNGLEAMRTVFRTIEGRGLKIVGREAIPLVWQDEHVEADVTVSQAKTAFGIYMVQPEGGRPEYTPHYAPLWWDREPETVSREEAKAECERHFNDRLQAAFDAAREVGE